MHFFWIHFVFCLLMNCFCYHFFIHKNDQHYISPYNTNTLSSRQVMRKKENNPPGLEISTMNQRCLHLRTIIDILTYSGRFLAMKHKTKQPSHLGELTLGSEPCLSPSACSPAILWKKTIKHFRPVLLRE